MAVINVLARYREIDGRDSMGRASIWQGNAGTLFGNNVVYSDPVLAIATTATKIKTTVTAPYTVGGGLYSFAATDNVWTFGVAASLTTVAINSFQKYAVCIDDVGVATVQEATPSTVSAIAVRWDNASALAGTFNKNPWGALTAILNASRCIFGVVTVATTTGTFIPGTTAFNAAGITTTFRASIEPALNPVLANERGLIAGIGF